MSFSLAELAAMPVNHDPSPDELPSIGFVGRIKPSTIERIYDLRLQERRRREIPACVGALMRLADDIEGWRQTITAETRVNRGEDERRK